MANEKIEYFIFCSATKDGKTTESSVALGDLDAWDKYERDFLDVVKKGAEMGVVFRYEVRHKNDAGEWVRDCWTLPNGAGWAQDASYR